MIWRLLLILTYEEEGSRKRPAHQVEVECEDSEGEEEGAEVDEESAELGVADPLEILRREIEQLRRELRGNATVSFSVSFFCLLTINRGGINAATTKAESRVV